VFTRIAAIEIEHDWRHVMSLAVRWQNYTFGPRALDVRSDIAIVTTL